MRGNKGREIEYKEIKMADYLMPNCEGLSISDKRYIFSMRNRMIQIPTNFPTKNKRLDEKCQICEEKETMNHLYICKWNNKNNNIKYEEIFGNHMKNLEKVYL